ncbi:MAG TPA: hypothetical protein VMJ72_00535 [Candidatus Paceibacterota bacterium]|nr:hypothetical protein [Candidatus Paceibacterota bacterium]
MKHIIIAVVVTAIVAGGAGYWYGGQHAQSSAAALRAGRFAQAGQGSGGTGARGGFGGAVNGDVVSVDAQGFTVSIQGGGSKVVIVPASATVMKSTAGALSDVSVGTHVTVIGAVNSDGSVTAQTIQIRPEMPTPTASPQK